MMALAEEKKAMLSDFMMKASEEEQAKFRIQVTNGKIATFMGESILIKAIKPFISNSKDS